MRRVTGSDREAYLVAVIIVALSLATSTVIGMVLSWILIRLGV